MDHLPLKYHLPEFRVPYLGGPLWDYESFGNWPDRLGYSSEFKFGILAEGERIEDLDRIAQCWLYFGLLECTTGTPISRETFVVPDAKAEVSSISASSTDKEQLISSKILPEIMDDWKTRIAGMDQSRKKELMNFVMSHLYLAEYAINEMVSNTLSRQSTTASRAVVLSILTLSAFIDTTAQRVFGSQYQRTTILFESMSYWLYEDMFVKYKWCPKTSAFAVRNLDTLDLCYVLSLGQQPNSRSHTCCSKAVRGALQSREKVDALHICPSEKTCTLIRPKVAAICHAIGQGDVPILKVRRWSPLRFTVKVEPYQIGMEYYAISHIWADRLASSKNAEVPVCQLERLYRYIESMHTDNYNVLLHVIRRLEDYGQDWQHALKKNWDVLWQSHEGELMNCKQDTTMTLTSKFRVHAAEKDRLTKRAGRLR